MAKSKTIIKSKPLNIQGMFAQPTVHFQSLRSTVDMIFYATQGGPFNIRQLANKVELDDDLETQIITVCANNYYSGKTPILQIGQAIRRLGPIGFRAVAMQAFLDLDVYKNPQWTKAASKIQSYSKAVAHACRIVSNHISQKQDLAFLTGMLHRVGISVPLLQLPGPKEDMLQSQRIATALSISHPFIAQRILRAWGMADELVDAIAGYGQIFRHDQPNILSAILIVAEELVQRIGIPEPVLIGTRESLSAISKETMEHAAIILDISKHETHLLLESLQEALNSASQKI